MVEKEEDDGSVKASADNTPAAASQKPKPKLKPRLDVIFLGDSSCGKSTVAGHLICKCDGADKKVMEQLAREAEEAGSQVCEYALVMDHFGRARGAGSCATPSAFECAPLWHIESESFRLAISEVPGDREFLKQTVAGGIGEHFDVAVLVVSAAPGELERGLSSGGQTREHALLAQCLGAQHLVVCVTKMDAAAPNPYSEARFDLAKQQTGSFLERLGTSVKAVVFVPVAGQSGENLVDAAAHMAWYKGPTLLQALDGLQPPCRPVHDPLRVTVREAYHLESVGAVAAGRVEAGVLRLGTQVQLAPGGASGKVRTIEADNATVREAYPRELVSFVVEGLGVADLRRGMVASEAKAPALEVETFLARIIVLCGPGEVTAGFSPVLACHSTQVPCRVEELVARLDRRTGEEVELKPAVLRAGHAGLVRFRPEQPVCLEAFDDCPQLGHFSTTREQTAITMMGIVSEVQHRKG